MAQLQGVFTLPLCCHQQVMASPSIFRSLSRSLTFATGDRLINRVDATPWPSPLHVKGAFTYFFHIEDHFVRTSIILAFCCVRAPCGGRWVGAVTPTANMAKLLSSSKL